MHLECPDTAAQHRQLVSFDVDLYQRHIDELEVVQPAAFHLDVSIWAKSAAWQSSMLPREWISRVPRTGYVEGDAPLSIRERDVMHGCALAGEISRRSLETSGVARRPRPIW